MHMRDIFKMGSGSRIMSGRYPLLTLLFLNLSVLNWVHYFFSLSRMTKTCWETFVTCLFTVCKKSQRPFVPSVGGIRLQCNV